MHVECVHPDDLHLVAGLRERDYRNGMKELMSGTLLEKIPFLSQMIVRPFW